MENANFWDDPNDYSLFIPEGGADLFGDPNFGFDLELFGDTGLDFALEDVSLPTLDYSSTVQNSRLVLLPELGVPNETDISKPVTSTQPDSGSSNPRSFNVLTSLATRHFPADKFPPSTVSTTTTIGNESSYQTISDKETVKRKISESMVIFSATSNAEVKPRKRKAFSKSRKEEVALNRRIGACIQCKIKKNACSFGSPCSQCVKRAGSAALGQVLCMRQGLLAIRFDYLDLFSPVSLRGIAEQISVSKARPSTEFTHLYFPGKHGAQELYVKVRLVEFEPLGYRPTQLLISMDYFGKWTSEAPNRRHAIYSRDLPSIGTLLEIYSITNREAHPMTGPFFGLQQAVRTFARAYCDSREDVPLRTLLEKSLRIQELFQMYRTTPFTKSSIQSQENEMVSTTMRSQIRLILYEELILLEVQMFSALEKLIYDKDGIGRPNPLVTWACLWTLIFTYKEHMVFTKPLAELKLLSVERYHLNQHIYNTLTSIYAALYKTTSPLTLDWRTAEISDMLGRDPELIRLFNHIKTEMYWFHAARDSLLEEDSLFKSLVVENESKLVTAHIKAAKKKGVL
ncbi:hypothetical protein BKA65DRAFT_205484 [Rhexocercosporidium sp. MPI-PUGE-AT-0058]|nr:hypothetical protein BKA65DRAFT_205484 [Rhexocercosporidium sp. MPI-PUGE-AT-0058]